MKKRLALCLVLVFVLAFVGTVFAACDDTSGLTDEQLTKLIGEVKSYHKNDKEITNENYGMIGKVSIPGDNGEIEVKVSWASSSDKVTVATEMGSTGFFAVTVPDRATLTEDLSYTLTGTLVDENGNAYKNSEGATYSATFNKKVEKKVSTEPDAILTFDMSSKATGEGTFTDQWGNTGYESVTWKENGITLVSKRGESVNGCVDNANPARFYKTSTMEISYTSKIKAIRLTFNSSSKSEHATGFDGMKVEGATIKRVGDVAVISFATPTEKFVSGPLASQTRIQTVEVFTSYVPELQDEVKYETVEEIIAALKTLEGGQNLPGGDYTLEGTIKSIDSPYNDQYKNVTVTIEVGAEKFAIQCYGMKGGQELVVGDTIKVTGVLTNYVNKEGASTIEFKSGCTYEKVGGGETPSTGSIVEPANAVKDTAYKLAVIKGDKTLYAKAEMDGYYIATSESASEGADIFVEAVEGGYKLYFKSGSNKIYLGAQASGTHANIGLSSKNFPETVWAYDTAKKCFTVTLAVEGAEGVYYMGSSGTYKTVSLSYSGKYTPGEGTNYVAALSTGAVSGGGNQGGGNQGGGGTELPTLGTPAATIDLTANHLQGDASSKTVTLNGITVTNDKGSSTSNVTIQEQYADRFYKNSNVTISYTTAMKAIKITCDDYDNGKYTTGLDGLTIPGATISHDGAVIVIEFSTAVTSVDIVGLTSQLRVNSIDVYTA